MRRKSTTSPITSRAKIWLERDGSYVFGLGISQILKAVEQTGSIKEAAAAVGRSYRHVWSRIKDVERDLGVRLVETRVGGADANRSDLTEAARVLIREFDRLRERVFDLVRDEFSRTLRSLPGVAARGD